MTVPKTCTWAGCKQTTPEHHAVEIYRNGAGNISVRRTHHWRAKVGWVGTRSNGRSMGGHDRAAYRRARNAARTMATDLGLGYDVIRDGWGHRGLDGY